jgi:hypothetical protein
MDPPLHGLHEFGKWKVVGDAIAAAEVNGLEWAVAARGVSLPVLQL